MRETDGDVHALESDRRCFHVRTVRRCPAVSSPGSGNSSDQVAGPNRFVIRSAFASAWASTLVARALFVEGVVRRLVEVGEVGALDDRPADHARGQRVAQLQGRLVEHRAGPVHHRLHRPVPPRRSGAPQGRLARVVEVALPSQRFARHDRGSTHGSDQPLVVVPDGLQPAPLGGRDRRRLAGRGGLLRGCGGLRADCHPAACRRHSRRAPVRRRAPGNAIAVCVRCPCMIRSLEESACVARACRRGGPARIG